MEVRKLVVAGENGNIGTKKTWCDAGTCLQGLVPLFASALIAPLDPSAQLDQEFKMPGSKHEVVCKSILRYAAMAASTVTEASLF